MNTNLDKVKNYYNTTAESEWNRLLTEGWLEYIIINHYLNKYVKPNSKIIDIGGGPGIYGIGLAKAGHEYNLFDLSSESIELAKLNSKKEGVTFNSYAVGNAADLSNYEADIFDVVINMGPLYHCIDHEMKRKIINESIRILKPGGLIVLGFMSKYAVAFYQLDHNPANITFMESTMVNAIEKEFHIESQSEPGFTDAAYVEPNEVTEIMKAYPVHEKIIIGAEGLISQSMQKIKNCNDEVKDKWVNYCINTAATNGALNSSEHIIYFGFKNDR
jgi:2-polyprenyl-3-methyl-5-hydroxy-6-metoxy-1,4-benzoquinol methylase